MYFKGFFYLVLEEKELKQLCLEKNIFLLQLFLILYTPKHLERKKSKTKKKKVSYLPYFFFRL